MRSLRYSLLTDGSSDRVLLPILNWLLRDHSVESNGTWADIRNTYPKPTGLSEKVRVALQLHPCELLFVHRDAENESPSHRVEEIRRAVKEITPGIIVPPVVCVIPIHMQEAWLLFDERAIRYAADNPNGDHPLSLPRLASVEGISDPKEVLYELLRNASGLRGRKLKPFRPQVRVHRIPDYIEDFSPLRNLSAFAALEKDLQAVIHELGWDHGPEES